MSGRIDRGLKIIFASLALAALGCAPRARRVSRDLMDDCERRLLPEETCKIELGCAPEQALSECMSSLRLRMKFYTGE